MAKLLYEEDFYAWTQQVAQSLRAGQVPPEQFGFIAEEIESLGKSEYRQLTRRLEILLTHLLKWKYQPDARCASWEITIRIQRKKIRDLLSENPSLKSKVVLLREKAYEDAVLEAMLETELPERTFPYQCPWVLDEILGDDNNSRR